MSWAMPNWSYWTYWNYWNYWSYWTRGASGAKYAIVKSSLTERACLGLYCTEMPEAIFEDIISVSIKGDKSAEEIKVEVDIDLYI